MGDLGLIPELGISAGERKGYPLQYSGLGNSTDSVVHGFSKSQTRLSNFHFDFAGEVRYSNCLPGVPKAPFYAGHGIFSNQISLW